MVRVPARRCRVCRKNLPKTELTRWTLQNGKLEQDMKQTATGRGYYSCSERCAEILPKTIKSHKKD